MGVLFEQLAILFAFMLVGFFFGKKGWIESKHSKIFSEAAFYLFLPATVFKAFYTNFNREYLRQYYPMILLSTGVLLFLILFAYLVAKLFAKDGYENRVYRYSLIIPNYAYMGYPLAESLYGSLGLLHMVIFGLPMSVYINSFGYCMLTKQKLSLKRVINPTLIAMLVGAVFGLLEIPLPNVAMTFVKTASGCMSPICMLLTGLSLAEFRLKDMFSDAKAYGVALIHLAVIPALLMLTLKPFFDESMVRAAILVYAMPCGMNPIIFGKLVDEDYHIGARLAVVSCLLSAVTIPLFLSFL
ncbi:MAG: AEC family transporter [Ruminococcaceae bacterium]|nr:AEC family transporter [Oscillospiraceae bacterium]